MLAVQQDRCRVSEDSSVSKMCIVIDADSREEAESRACQSLAIKTAGEHGFANAGFSATPTVHAINEATKEVVQDAEAFDPNTKVSGFRAEFMFSQRL